MVRSHFIDVLLKCLADNGESIEGGVFGLIDMLTTEIKNHHDHYKNFITGDWKKDLHDYKLYKKFDSDIVDLLLHALANSTSTSCYVVNAEEDIKLKQFTHRCCRKRNFCVEVRPPLLCHC